MGAMLTSPGKRAASNSAAPAKTSASFSTSPRRLPGNTASTRALGVEPEFGARRGAIDLERNLVGERVTDECRAYAMFAIEIRFEREQAQHQVHRRADGAHAPLPPGPDLRAHVLHGGKAGALELSREPQIEFLVVDADEHVGTPVEDLPAQLRRAGA